MSRYWSGNTKILLLIGVPCIITTYTIAVVPRNLYVVGGLLHNSSGFDWMLDSSPDFRAWFGVVIVLSLLVIYFIVAHILFCCKCSKNRNASVYCYLSSIGIGYCGVMDLFFCILAPALITQSSAMYFLIMGNMFKYAMLSVGIAWLFTITVGIFFLNSQSNWLRVLTPVIGSLISFGLPLFIVLISGIGFYNMYSDRYFLVSAFVLAILSLICYLLTYFVEFQKKR